MYDNEAVQCPLGQAALPSTTPDARRTLIAPDGPDQSRYTACTAPLTFPGLNPATGTSRPA
jgi:hypothetical protein